MTGGRSSLGISPPPIWALPAWILLALCHLCSSVPDLLRAQSHSLSFSPSPFSFSREQLRLSSMTRSVRSISLSPASFLSCPHAQYRFCDQPWKTFFTREVFPTLGQYRHESRTHSAFPFPSHAPTCRLLQIAAAVISFVVILVSGALDLNWRVRELCHWVRSPLSIVFYRTEQCSTVQDNTVLCSTVQCSAVRYSAVQYRIIESHS